MVLTDGIRELPSIVRELAMVKRELGEAQRRTELRVEELAEAQHRIELRVEELAQAQGRLTSAVGELQRAFGATVEEEAASVIEVIMHRKGYHILQPAFSLALDGEVDVVLPLIDLAVEPVWAVVDAKARLSRRDVQAWSQLMHSAGWHKRLAEKGCRGPYLVYTYRFRADLGAQELAAKEGIGLLKSDGEILAPREPIKAIVT